MRREASTANVFRRCWRLITEKPSGDSGFIESMEVATGFFASQQVGALANQGARTVDHYLQSTTALARLPRSLADGSSDDVSSVDMPNQNVPFQHYQFDFNERRHATLAATALQAVIYTSSQLPVASFCAWQRAIEALLIHTTPVMKSVVSSVDALRPLSHLLQLTAAQGYLGLLTHHRCSPLSEMTFHSMLRSLQCNGANSALSMPLGPRSPHIHACWQTSLSLMHWATHFQSTGSTRVSLVSEGDTENVLRSVLLRFGDRDTSSDGNALRDELIHTLRQHLGNVSSLDHREVRVRGKKFELAPNSNSEALQGGDSGTVTPHMASETLFAGKWMEVLSSFSQLMMKDSNTMEKWPFHRSYYRCSDEQRHRLRTILQKNRTSEASRVVTDFHFRHVVPTSAPKSLVRFEGVHTYRALSYVERCPRWELLPFAVVAGMSSGSDAVLSSIRDTLVAPLMRVSSVWAQHYQSLGDLMIAHSLSFLSQLEPELSRHRRVVREMYRPHWMPLELLRSSASCIASVDSEQDLLQIEGLKESLKEVVPKTLSTAGSQTFSLNREEWLVAHLSVAHSWDNYWLSSWLEMICSIGALETSIHFISLLLGAEGYQSTASPKHNNNNNAVSSVVLSPECAVAFATAAISMAIDRGQISPQKPETAALLRAKLGLPESIPFVVPAVMEGPETDQQSGGAASVRRYFRWIHRPEFYSYVAAGEAEESSWGGPLGLLGGRVFRLATHLPNASNQRAPCKMSMWRLHIEPLLEFGQSLNGKSEKEKDAVSAPLTTTTDMTLVTSFDHHQGEGAGRPAVAVVFKPTATSTTLHHSGPSVSTFLARSGLWWSPSWAPGSNNVLSPHDVNGVSVLAQEGLVNRIDRGTSGLVIAACNQSSLFHQRRIQLVQQGSKKTYYAIVVHIAPTDRAIGMASLWTPGSCPFFLPPRGVIGGEVVTEGSKFASRQQAQYNINDRNPPTTTTLNERREASTSYVVVEAFYPTSDERRLFLSAPHYLVRVQLTNGRRHQIRQHFASIHHPLLGDVQYHPRAATSLMDRAALHASEVTIWESESAAALTHRHHDGGYDDALLEDDDDDVKRSRTNSSLSVESLADELVTRRRRSLVACNLPEDMRRVIGRLRRASRYVEGKLS